MPVILAVLPYYLPFPGGAEKSTHERLRRLADGGFQVSVLVAPIPHHLLSALAAPTEMDGVRIIRPTLQCEFLDLLKNHANSAEVIFYSRANLLRRIYDIQIEKILRPLRNKIMYFVHDLDPSDYFDAAFVISNSEATRAGIPENVKTKSLVLKPLIRTPSKQRSSGRRFVTIINPTLLKGGDVFAKLAHELPSVSFLAQLGSGVPVESIYACENIEVRQSTADISDVYSATSVLVVPSKREPFGRVALEAALAGCLVLVHRIDGLQEVPLPQYSFVEGLSVEVWKDRLLCLLNKDYRTLEALRRSTADAARSYNPGWETFLSALFGLQDPASTHMNPQGAPALGTIIITTIADIFKIYLPDKFREQPTLSNLVNRSYKFVILGPERSSWIVNLRHTPVEISETDGVADCTIVIFGPDLLSVVRGELSFEYLTYCWSRISATGDRTAMSRLSLLLR